MGRSCRPNPSIEEIEIATHDFCALEWANVKENMMGKDKKHAFTKSSQLHNRCLEALYMTTLLEYGFGFDSSHRNITLALEVMGHEVEWTLGFALAEVPLPNVELIKSEKSAHSLHFEISSVIKKCIAACLGVLQRIKNFMHFIFGRS